MYYPTLHKMPLSVYEQLKAVVRIWLTLHVNNANDELDPIVKDYLTAFVRSYLEAVLLSPEFMNSGKTVSEEAVLPYLEKAKVAAKAFTRGDFEVVKQKFDFAVDLEKECIYATIIKIIKIEDMYFEVLSLGNSRDRIPKIVSVYSELIFKHYESRGFLRVSNSEWAFEVQDSKNSVMRRIENLELPKLYNAAVKIVKKKNNLTAYVTLHEANTLVDSFYVSRVEDLISRDSFYGFALYTLAERNKNVVGHLKVKSNYEPDTENRNYRQYMRIVTTLFPVMQIDYSKKISILKSKIKERVSYKDTSFNVRAKACNVIANFGRVALTHHSVIRYLERSVRWQNFYPTKPYDSLCKLLTENEWRLATIEDRNEYSLPHNESYLFISDTTTFVLACERNDSYEHDGLNHLLTILCKGNEETILTPDP